jgi:hypothetical protein
LLPAWQIKAQNPRDHTSQGEVNALGVQHQAFDLLRTFLKD